MAIRWRPRIPTMPAWLLGAVVHNHIASVVNMRTRDDEVMGVAVRSYNSDPRPVHNSDKVIHKPSTRYPQNDTQHIHRHTLVLLFRINKHAQNALKCVLEACQNGQPVDNSATQRFDGRLHVCHKTFTKHSHKNRILGLHFDTML